MLEFIVPSLTHLSVTSLIFFFNDTATPEIYTLSLPTLFRSGDSLRGRPGHGRVPWVESHTGAGTDTSSASRVRHPHASGRDRKSTRLNSSHSQISYAVFCLKKKKKNRNQQTNHNNQYKRNTL